MCQWMLGEAQERLEMGQWGREGVKVLHEVELGHLKQGEAAGQLGLSEGGFRRGLKRDRAKGGRGVARGLRGRAWNRRIEEEEVARAAVRVVKKEYSDLGPRLGASIWRGSRGFV